MGYTYQYKGSQYKPEPLTVLDVWEDTLVEAIHHTLPEYPDATRIVVSPEANFELLRSNIFLSTCYMRVDANGNPIPIPENYIGHLFGRWVTLDTTMSAVTFRFE